MVRCARHPFRAARRALNALVVTKTHGNSAFSAERFIKRHQEVVSRHAQSRGGDIELRRSPRYGLEYSGSDWVLVVLSSTGHHLTTGSGGLHRLRMGLSSVIAHDVLTALQQVLLFQSCQACLGDSRPGAGCRHLPC